MSPLFSVWWKQRQMNAQENSLLARWSFLSSLGLVSVLKQRHTTLRSPQNRHLAFCFQSMIIISRFRRATGQPSLSRNNWKVGRQKLRNRCWLIFRYTDPSDPPNCCHRFFGLWWGFAKVERKLYKWVSSVRTYINKKWSRMSDAKSSTSLHDHESTCSHQLYLGYELGSLNF